MKVTTKKDTWDTEWLSKRVEGGAPGDLPRRYIRHNEANFKKQLVELEKEA